jgi:hypothetical protein
LVQLRSALHELAAFLIILKLKGNNHSFVCFFQPFYCLSFPDTALLYHTSRHLLLSSPRVCSRQLESQTHHSHRHILSQFVSRVRTVPEVGDAAAVCRQLVSQRARSHPIPNCPFYNAQCRVCGKPAATAHLGEASCIVGIRAVPNTRVKRGDAVCNMNNSPGNMHNS